MLFPIFFLLNIYTYIFHSIPRTFRQLSHGFSVYLSVTSVISKAPTMDPAMPPHRPWPQTGSCGTWTNKNGGRFTGRCWPAFASSRNKRDPPVEKRGHGHVLLNFRGMVKVKKKWRWTLIGTTLKILNLDGWNFGKIQNAEKKNHVKMSALPGTEMAMLSSELLLSWSRFWHFGGFSDSDDYPTILGLFSSPFSWGNTSFLAPNSS